MRDKRLRLDYIFPVIYEEDPEGVSPPVVVKQRSPDNPFQGQQSLHILGFTVLLEISSADCMRILEGYGEFALCPGGKLWTLVKKKLPTEKWCVLFDQNGCVWRIDNKKSDRPEDSPKLHYRIGSFLDRPLKAGECLGAAYYKLRDIIYTEEVA